MDRKKTILIAVLMNAGLLAVLLIAALTTQEEIAVPKEIVENASMEPRPLFSEPLDLPTKEAPLVAEASVPQLSPVTPVQELPIHKLPPLAEVPVVRDPIALPEPLLPHKEAVVHKEVAVKKGDTLEKMAREYQTTVDEIIKLNRLPSSFLRVGQMIKIPAAKKIVSAPKLKPASPIEKTGGPEYYTVKVGDNPWTIAMKHHIKVEELLRLNGLNEEKARKLKPGDRLRTK